MKRILVFNSECSVCTGIAHKVCNEAGELIHDVWSLADVRTKEILQAAGMIGLDRPALFEITSDKTEVLTGPRFRWNVMRLLGPQRAMRLVRVIAGDLAAGTLEPGQQRGHRDAVQAHSPEAKTPALMSRRKLLGAMTTLAAGFAIVTGIGFSKFAHAGKKNTTQKSTRPVEPFLFKWVVDLYPEPLPKIVITGAERNSRWQKFAASEDLGRLLTSRDFEAYSGALEIQAALLSGEVPPDSSTFRRGTDNIAFESCLRVLPNGDRLYMDMMAGPNLMFHAVEHHNGLHSVRSGMKLYEHDHASKRAHVLASLTNGGFDFKSTKFSKRNLDIASSIAGRADGGALGANFKGEV